MDFGPMLASLLLPNSHAIGGDDDAITNGM